VSSQPGWVMNWVDRLRTSENERVLSVGFPNYVELIDPTFRDAGEID